jgi:hypothetical protein
MLILEEIEIAVCDSDYCKLEEFLGRFVGDEMYLCEEEDGVWGLPLSFLVLMRDLGFGLRKCDTGGCWYEMKRDG